MPRLDPYTSIQSELNSLLSDFKISKNPSNISSAVKLLRKVNIYPTPAFDTQGKVDEGIKCIKRDVSDCIQELESTNSIQHLYLKCRYLQGLTLCRYIFPEIAYVKRNKNAKSVFDSFMDDKDLHSAVKYLFETRPACNAPQLHSILGIVMSNCFNNFNPSRTKALCEYFCPNGGVVYDFSAGFGGRMLGCLTSKNDYVYIGVDPNTEIQEHYVELQEVIQEAFDQLNIKRDVKAHVECTGSENFCPKELRGKVDFAFSSPPFFSREYYTDEPTQCYNKFSDLDSWVQNYVKPTIQNINTMLKKGGHVAFNICNFGSVDYIGKWFDIALECGLKHTCLVSSQKESRVGSGHDRHATKTEEIYVFRKI